METREEFSSVVQLLPDAPPSVVSRYNAPDDPHEATALTIDRMKQWAADRAHSPQVTRATMQALLFGNGSDLENAIAIHNWIGTHCRFVEDDRIMRVVFNLEDELEMLIEPAQLLSMKPPAGDCDCLTTLCMSMLLCAGIPAEPITIKADPEQPELDSHVYCQAILQDGSTLILDPAMACKRQWPAGAEAPNYFDRQTWGPIYPEQPRRGLHGLDDCADNELCSTDIGIPGTGGGPGTDLGVAAGPYPTAGGFNWGQLATVLGADATRIAQLATLPSGYTLNPAGQPVYAGASAFGAINPLYLLLGGGVLLIALLGSRK